MPPKMGVCTNFRQKNRRVCSTKCRKYYIEQTLSQKPRSRVQDSSTALLALSRRGVSRPDVEVSSVILSPSTSFLSTSKTAHKAHTPRVLPASFNRQGADTKKSVTKAVVVIDTKRSKAMSPCVSPTPQPATALKTTSRPPMTPKPPKECQGKNTVSKSRSPAPGSISPSTPTSSFKTATEMMRVAFRPLGKPEIVGNDPKLKKLYADTAGFWLEGLVRETTMRKVVVPAVEASVGKKGRTAKTMTEFVSLHTVNWLDTRFNAHAPRICMATMLKGIANYARLKATKSFNKSRTYVKICAYEPEPLELSAVDMQELNAEGNDEEGSTDEYFVDEGNDTSGSSDEDFSEYVDRTWKKKATISTNDIEGLGNVRWEYDAKCIGPQDLYEHDDGTTAPVDIKIRPQFEDLFVDPTRGNNISIIHVQCD
ncbi:hypothetical protein DYB30_013358 [Aphanomyces astaci]|uniref:Uncharacterized protein n=1 Tax=Aphanomyces astaci TaxID=112090 RepID=A0A397CUI6_APHAT|nr:hypothetical protein DYB30_013358 [Aphanomyces astaci]